MLRFFGAVLVPILWSWIPCLCFKINGTIRNSYAFTHIEAVFLVSCQLLAQLHKVTDSRLVSPAVLLSSYIKEVGPLSCLASKPSRNLRGQTLAFYSNASVKPTVVFLSPPEDSLCTLHCICKDSLLHQWGGVSLYSSITSLRTASSLWACITSVRTICSSIICESSLCFYYICEERLCSPIKSVRIVSDPQLHQWG